MHNNDVTSLHVAKVVVQYKEHIACVAYYPASVLQTISLCSRREESDVPALSGNVQLHSTGTELGSDM